MFSLGYTINCRANQIYAFRCIIIHNCIEGQAGALRCNSSVHLPLHRELWIGIARRECWLAFIKIWPDSIGHPERFGTLRLTKPSLYWNILNFFWSTKYGSMGIGTHSTHNLVSSLCGKARLISGTWSMPCSLSLMISFHFSWIRFKNESFL